MTGNPADAGSADVTVCGGGAAGMMAALQAARRGRRVTLLEKNPRLGRKILISGGGRCNFTNLGAAPDRYVGSGARLLRSAFHGWTVEDTIAFFAAHGIEGREKKLGQLFPSSDRAEDVLVALEAELSDAGVEVRTGATVDSIDREGNGFRVRLRRSERTEQISSPRLVLALGGLAYPQLGASGLGLDVAKAFGHRVVETAPALVPLVPEAETLALCRDLSGLALPARVSIGKTSFRDDLLFAHFGFSGPAILQISSHWLPGETVRVDFLPDSPVEEIVRTGRETSPRRHLSNLLAETLPQRLVARLPFGALGEKPVGQLRKEEIETVREILHRFAFRPVGTMGYVKAEVMRGGVDATEIHHNRMESKLVPGLFFCGECVDVTGWLGGYNFQWAWASGALAGRSA